MNPAILPRLFFALNLPFPEVVSDLISSYDDTARNTITLDVNHYM
jgi:hypothetical protein